MESGPFTRALVMIRDHPVLLVPGTLFAVLCGAIVVIGDFGGMYFGWKLIFLVIIIEPFFVAGFLSLARAPEGGIRGMFSGGMNYYFRVLLPWLIIGFALILTLVLLMIPITLLGMNPAGGIISGAALGIAIPFVFFTWFFDTAAVLENQKVFESIRRSIEVVLIHGWRALSFFIVTMAIVTVALFSYVIALSGALLERLEPLTRMNATDYQNYTPAQFAEILGQDGIWIATILGMIWIAVTFSVIYAYKTAFFMMVSSEQPAAPAGEFDSKGRWYKY